MARIRTIKPDFFKNDEMAELPVISRLLFIGLLTQCDRRGRLEDRPNRLKAEIFPYDEINIDEHLNYLHDACFILRYDAKMNEQKKRLIQVINFEKHQRISGSELLYDSEYPAPDGSTLEAPWKHCGSTVEKSGRTQEALRKHSGSTQEAPWITGKERKGKEGKEKEKKTLTCFQKEKKAERFVFLAPDFFEIENYFCSINGGKTDAEAFYDHFTSNGWLVGGKAKMKDWKAAARNWLRRGSEKEKKYPAQKKEKTTYLQNNISEFEKFKKEFRHDDTQQQNA